jgi:hypothetical protein
VKAAPYSSPGTQWQKQIHTEVPDPMVAAAAAVARTLLISRNSSNATAKADRTKVPDPTATAGAAAAAVHLAQSQELVEHSGKSIYTQKCQIQEQQQQQQLRTLLISRNSSNSMVPLPSLSYFLHMSSISTLRQ